MDRCKVVQICTLQHPQGFWSLALTQLSRPIPWSQVKHREQLMKCKIFESVDYCLVK